MERALESFQHRVVRRITGKQPRRRVDGSWEYPPLAEALGGAGFEGIRKSVTRRQNTVAQYIETQPILDLCERAPWRLVDRVSQQWWDHTVIDLEGAKKRVVETTTISELESEEESDMEANADSGGEEKSKGTRGLSGSEWSEVDE